MDFSSMSSDELSSMVSEVQGELEKRKQIANDASSLADISKSFTDLAQSLATLRGVSQNEILSQYLPSEFIDWVALGGASSSAKVSQWVQPTSDDTAYDTGNRAIYQGVTYISLEDNNRYSPQAYPQGWRAL